MTPRCSVRAALTKERSKAKIKSSALRCCDEKSLLTRAKKGTQLRSFLVDTGDFMGRYLLCFIILDINKYVLNTAIKKST